MAFLARAGRLLHQTPRFNLNQKLTFSTTVQHPKDTKSVRHILKIDDLSSTEVLDILSCAIKMKSNLPESCNIYNKTLEKKTLLMLFEKASLRTRVSFETGMTELGGHAIFYSISDSPLGEKETFSDTALVLSRYCHCIMARVKSRHSVNELSKYSNIPVINGLDDYAHPCQILADLLTIQEYKQYKHNMKFNDLKFVYFGDIHNNVTYDLMRGCTLMGFKQCIVCGPMNHGDGIQYNVEQNVIDECNIINSMNSNGDNNNKCDVVVTDDIEYAAKDADIIYTDSWMSYGIDKELMDERIKIFEKYRVDDQKMKLAKKDCIFMNCLPAMRGMEQTESVIDGAQSVVFDQAENRLHAQKALLLFLMNGNLNSNIHIL